MAMYSAYFDESGSEDSEYFVVAGCIADVEQWIEFEREWTELLSPLGTRIFHTVDFHSRSGPFNQLTPRKAGELLSRLVGVICRRVERTISRALKMAEYKATNENYVFADCYGNPYPLLCRSCMGLVETWAQKHTIPTSDLLYFFENGAKHKGQLRWIAERDRLPVPIFLNKTDSVPIQAGDLLAWCQNLHLTSNGRIPQIYDEALDHLSEKSNEWGIIRMADPERIPTILGIPRRDPSFTYKYQIRKHKGRRLALTHYWPKNRIEPKVEKQTLQLPAQPLLTLDAVMAAVEEYDRRKAQTIVGPKPKCTAG